MNNYLNTAALCLLLLSTAFAHAKPTAIVSFSDTRVAPGEVITATITLKDMPKVYGVQLSGKFSADYLKVQPSEKPAGLAIQEFLTKPQAFTVKNSVDQKSGNFEFIHALLHPEKEVSGSGTLATIQFTAEGEGQATFAIDTLKFGTKDGQVIEPVIVNKAQASVTLVSVFDIEVILIIAAFAILLIGIFIAAWLTAKKSSRKTSTLILRS